MIVSPVWQLFDWLHIVFHFLVDKLSQIIESSKVKGERELREKQEKVQIEIEKCHRRVEEFAEYSDLSLMQQYCKEITV